MSENLNKSKKFVEELKERGLIFDFCKGTEEKLSTLLAVGKKIYLGIDPTADFLHLGHYLSISIAKRFVKAGYKVIFVIGNFTSQIGDPSFRSKKRIFLSEDDVLNNSNSIKKHIGEIMFQAGYRQSEEYEFAFNYRFWENLGPNIPSAILSFINNLCGKIKINELISKDFLKNRKEDGLTLAESLYPVLQAYDFFHLWKNEGVGIQIGGQDQWTNILYGLDLIEYSSSTKDIDAMGMTFPLIEDDKGNKLGKSDGNAIDIFNKEFQIYQLLKNVDDSLVEKYLKMLTFKDLNVVKDWLNMGKKAARDRLAFEVCSDIYGEELAQKFEALSANLFAGDFSKFSAKDLKYLEQWLPTKELDLDSDISLFEAFQDMNIVSSRTQFNELIKSKGIYVFGKDIDRLRNITSNITISRIDCEHSFDLGNNEVIFVLFLRKGKKDYGMIKFWGFSENKDLLLG